MTGSLQTKNGKFYMVLNCTENGKRKQKWLATGLPEKGNKRKAEQMLHEKLAALEHTAPSDNAADILFTDYIRHWLTIVEQRVDAVTMQSYRAITERHILPWFSNCGLTLAAVNRKSIQTFLDEKGRCGRLDGKGGLSPKSIRELKNIINQVLNEAIREELLTVNPCSLLRLPPKARPQAQFYTAEQLNILLQEAQHEQLYPIIKTAIIYGLRRSELLGLKWDSIDFENNVLTIKHTVVKIYETVEKDKAKSKSSYRSFPLLPEMRYLFLELKQEQRENKRLFGKCYIENDYVFCWPDGHPVTPDYVSHRFGKILKNHNLPHIRFHELRHPYVKHTTKIFSLRLMDFQAQAYPDARRKTRGACQLHRGGQSRSPVRPLCNRKRFSCLPPQSKMSWILYAISMRLSGYTSTRSISISASSVVSASASKIALDASFRLSCRTCSSCFCFACANTAA